MIRLSIRVRAEQAELVLAQLLELAPSGVQETELPGEVTEYAVYGPPGELPALGDLQAAAGGALVQISTEEIADDWAQRWRDFHRPLVLEGRLTVRPPWEPAASTPIDVVIDPGQAFGTGAHATTRLCLELMLDLDRQQPDDSGAARSGSGMTRARPDWARPDAERAAGSSGCRAGGKPEGAFVDVGCGSGVLAIVAAKLGFAPVIALDYDPAAVSATRDNAGVNDVGIDVRRFDLRSEQVPGGDLVAANVLAGPLRSWAASQRQLPPRLILSGLLIAEADGVASAFAARGLTEHARRTRGEWAALGLQEL